ncbi:MAG: protease inhibitor I42 family protein [Dehalococcoidia bacterium]|nr:protease inhibitor I42 family protein [Dehalococcoidia bacterium]
MRRHHKLAIVLVVTAVTLAVLVARLSVSSIVHAPTKPPEYTASDSRIEARVGETFVIVLESNRTTGYGWALAEQPNAAVVTLVGSEYVARGVGIPGQGGEERWTFRAAGAGAAALRLAYMRPWEKDMPPAKTQTYAVSVR